MAKTMKTTIEELQDRLKQADNIIEMQQKQIEDLQKQYSNLVSQEEYNILLKQYIDLKAQYNILSDLYKNQSNKTKHNERGAGRKKLGIDDEVINLREQGCTIIEIAQKLNVGIATVNRVIKRNK